MSKSRVEQAVSYFEAGFVCSQAIFATYSQPLGLKTETALKIAESFYAGIGGMAEICGAVAGAFMVIGLKYGRAHAEDTEAKEKTRTLIKEFVEQFKERHGTIVCKELLEVDISTDEGRTAAKEKGLFETQCPQFVRDAAEILENIMG